MPVVGQSPHPVSTQVAVPKWREIPGKEETVSVEQVVPGLYAIRLGGVNAFLIDSDELILVDTGVPNSADMIVQAVEAIGRKRGDVRHILVTHCHPDHAGSLAEVKKRTGASAYMHPLDAAITRIGKVTPDLKPAPGMDDLFRQFIGLESAEYDPAEIDYEVHDGDELPIGGGIRVIHVPGHCAGQLAFLWRASGGVLFAADTASNMMGLGYSLGYADMEEGKRSLLKLAALDFAVACFGHGQAIVEGASAQFRQKWGSE
jgi:glyoxylase-like metal-dependent hydrolase (beta-lactamase superfamily II)